MKERPILFSGEMVNAILEDRKSQTRRIVKAEFQRDLLSSLSRISPHQCGEGFLLERWPRQERAMGNFGRCEVLKCPYGKPGDRLWVRETWGIRDGKILYRADGEGIVGVRWSPSIHMFRDNSRITLEITDVRVQRLQEISEEDAIAEGTTLPVSTDGCPKGKAIPMLCISRTVEGHPLWTKPDHERTVADFWTGWYALLWEEINGPGSWAANPWVWSLTFRRLS